MSDPWTELATPGEATMISARRVDEHLSWNFYWAKGADRKCLLILRHGPDAGPSARLPNLNGVEISETEAEDGQKGILVFRLTDSGQRALFEQLCRDIVCSTVPAQSEQEAIDLALARTWRWHHLLRGGSSEHLSEEEQKGLIGELLVLERHLLVHLAPADAVEAWRGPLGAPKDFEIGRICIEAKARRGAASPFVTITSEHQLDGSGVGDLFLHVCDLSAAPSGDTAAFTVTDVARRTRDRIDGVDQSAVELFDARLMASGFEWRHDYSAARWISGRARIYHVTEQFPRISAADIPAGVSNVRYSLGLSECERFVLAPEALDTAIAGVRNGN